MPSTDRPARQCAERTKVSRCAARPVWISRAQAPPSRPASAKGDAVAKREPASSMPTQTGDSTMSAHSERRHAEQALTASQSRRMIAPPPSGPGFEAGRTARVALACAMMIDVDRPKARLCRQSRRSSSIAMRRIAWVLIVANGLARIAAAQDQEPSVFRGALRSPVIIDLVATDRNGRFVTDLQPCRRSRCSGKGSPRRPCSFV